MDLVKDIDTLSHLPAIVSHDLADKTALIVGDEALSYLALDARSHRIANALIRDGIAVGDRVAILGKESLPALCMLFGVAKAQAVFVPINWRLAAAEIRYIVEDAGAKLWLVDPAFAPLVTRALEGMTTPPRIIVSSGEHGDWLTFERWLDGASDASRGRVSNSDDVVAQLYTSGTTGHPKGVQLAHRSFFALAKEMHAVNDPWIGWTHESTSLVMIPTFHIGGLFWLIRGLAFGSTNVVLPSFEASQALRAIAKHRVSTTCMVPAMLQVLLREPESKTLDLSCLRSVVYGGSPIAAALLSQGMATLGCAFYQIYGLTETGNMAVCLRAGDHAREQLLRAAGKPFPGVEARILDEQGAPVAAGVVGEIALKTPARMVGYWRKPEATQATLVDGWIHTGDAGYRDEEGYLYVCDRLKDMIIAAGENIYPAEIENVLRSHPEVADVAVIGVPDDLWGEAVKAFVVRREGSEVRPAALLAHARAQLAEFKVPRSFEFVSELPRTASGKLMKHVLREPFWRGRDRRVN